MNIQAEKINLLQQILETSDKSLLKDIKSVITSHSLDWFDSLSKSQKNDIKEGLIQLDKGDVINHQALKALFKR